MLRSYEFLTCSSERGSPVWIPHDCSVYSGYNRANFCLVPLVHHNCIMARKLFLSTYKCRILYPLVFSAIEVLQCASIAIANSLSIRERSKVSFLQFTYFPKVTCGACNRKPVVERLEVTDGGNHGSIMEYMEELAGCLGINILRTQPPRFDPISCYIWKPEATQLLTAHFPKRYKRCTFQ